MKTQQPNWAAQSLNKAPIGRSHLENYMNE